MTGLASGAARYATGERRASLTLGAFALAAAAAYAVAIVDMGGEPVLLAPVVGAILVLAIFAHPAIGLYVLFGAAILFEQFAVKGLSPITQYARFFQNLSAYTPIPIRLSPADLLVLLTFASLLAQRFRAKHQPLRMGAFGWPVLAYLGVFVLGTVIGAVRGDWKPDIALAELRAPVQLCLLYFLAANLIGERRQLRIFMWLFVAFVAIKAVQGILNYFDARSLPYYVEAVTNHEDVIFFAVAVALMVIAVVLRIRNRLTYALIALLPVVLAVEVLSQRRVGLVALGVVLIAIALLTLATDVRRGMVLVGLGTLGVVAYSIIFWDATGPMGEPIRALRSVFEPSSTSLIDQSSNAWRELEARNIAFTVRQLPLTGVGVGQAYLFQQEPSTLFGFLYWRYITHNALLWLWLKAGPLGALALWFLIARILLVGSALYVRLRDNELRLVIALPLTLIVSQVVFSAVDLGLTYSRTMIVLGTSLGMAALLARQHPPQRVAIASEGSA